MNFIKVLFGKKIKSSTQLFKVETLRIVVAEFVEYGNYNFGQALVKLLQKNPIFNVSYFTESFDKNFLSLQGRHFFDLSDAGNKILQKLNADIVIWGYQENEYIRLNFQTANAYSDWDNVSCSILDSLYIPVEHFEHINFFPSILEKLLTGFIATAISEQRIDLRHLKQKLLKSVIAKFNISGPSEEGQNTMLLPYTMNAIGLTYLGYNQKDLTQKDFEISKDLFNKGLSQKEHIMQNVHIGCIYKNLGQLYETALKQELGNQWILFKEAITNYRTAQRYIDHYNYPYDFALISFKLSLIYFRYWKFTNDIQALRDAVFFLREAEKTYNQISFPELWSKIEGYLGFYLSLLGLFSKSNDISKLAIKSYKNKQTVYRKELFPIMWAKIQENIANVYYNMGKNSYDKSSFQAAIDYYQSALKIYENKHMHQEITIVNNSIDKVLRALRG